MNINTNTVKTKTVMQPKVIDHQAIKNEQAELTAQSNVVPLKPRAGTATAARAAREKTQAARLLDYLENEEMDIFSTPDDKFYISLLNDKNHLETVPLGGRYARQRFAQLFYSYENSTIGSQGIQEAIDVLSADAHSVKKDVFVRMAQADENIYLDLATKNFDVIEIRADGWTVKKSNDVPVKFVHPKGMEPLPMPSTTPDFFKLKSYLNINDGDFILLAGWLVSCFKTDMPLPVLTINGEQGTAKSTASKMIKQLIDPRFALLTSTPREERDLIISASNQWILAFDNISSIPQWLSDALCRLSTGAGFATRQLHTDGEETIFNALRAVILNGIGDLATRPDLLRRAVQVELTVISAADRKEEKILFKDFKKALPSILAGLVEAVSKGLANFENVEQKFVSTMPDFERWAVACETALGFDDGAFRNKYCENIEQAQAIALENSIVGTALRDLMDAPQTSGVWCGQLKTLHSELINSLDDTQKKSFPKRPQDLRQELVRLKPVLRNYGIELDADREQDRKKFVSVTKVEQANV